MLRAGQDLSTNMLKYVLRYFNKSVSEFNTSIHSKYLIKYLSTHKSEFEEKNFFWGGDYRLVYNL